MSHFLIRAKMQMGLVLVPSGRKWKVEMDPLSIRRLCSFNVPEGRGLLSWEVLSVRRCGGAGTGEYTSVGKSQGKSNGLGRVDKKGQSSFKKDEAPKPQFLAEP